MPNFDPDRLIRLPWSEDYYDSEFDITYTRLPWSEDYVDSFGEIYTRQPWSENYESDGHLVFTRQPNSENYIITGSEGYDVLKDIDDNYLIDEDGKYLVCEN